MPRYIYEYENWPDFTWDDKQNKPYIRESTTSSRKNYWMDLLEN
jgi:hypothetical protein